MAVVVIFPVGIVVLVVVRDQIVQRKAIVRGDKIDAGPRAAAALIVQIAGTKQARGKVG